MGRNKRTSFADNNGTNSDADSVPVTKKSKRVAEAASKKAAREQKTTKKSNSSVGKGKNSVTPTRGSHLAKLIYSDSSSSSESDSEKNSVRNDKKSEKSLSDSNSDSDSDSDSDSWGSDSSQGSRAGKETKSGSNATNSVVNLNPVSSYDPPPKSSGSDSYHSDTEEEDKKRRKKQKEMLKMQLTKKGKRGGIPRKQDSFAGRMDSKEDDMDDDLKDENEDGGDAQGNSDDVIDWPESDVCELLRRMEEQIPARDNQKFDSRAAKLDWDKIAFGEYSKQECQDMWNLISKRIRRFRNLSEMLADAKDWAKKPWTNFYRGSKKNRHPDMPNKPLSAYMIYYLEQKDRVIEENKGVDLMQISKIITEMYKNLSDKEREKYSHKAASQKQNFDEKISEFYKEHPECEPQPQVKSSTRDVVKGPRKPYAPFKLFFQEEYKNQSDGSVDKKTLEEFARERWKNLSDKKKAEWIKLSLNDYSRFEKELKAVKQKHPDYVTPNFNKNILNKEERLIMERLSGKPLKPPNSAYSLFSRHMLQSDNDVKSKAPKLRMAEISKKWKEISTDQKKQYEQKVKQLQDDYKSKLQSYLKSLTPEERERELEFVKKQKRKKKNKLAKKALKNKSLTGKSKNNVRGSSKLSIFEGEPKAPPETECELFLERFLENTPSSMNKEKRLKKALGHWQKLPESKKALFTEELIRLKRKYVVDYKEFLKGLSAAELKKYTARKVKAKKEEKVQTVNGTLTDSNDESDEEKCESSSEGSGSDESDSEKSKSCSSSDDSDG